MFDLTRVDRSILLTSDLIPTVVLFFLIPTAILRRFPSLTTIFLSLTAGGLMAEVVLRFLPNIILFYDQSSQNRHYDRAGLLILTGIFLSLIIEKVLRYFKDHSDEQITSTSAVPLLFLTAEMFYKYTNHLTLSLPFRSESTIQSTLIGTKVTYGILHVLYGYTTLMYHGWTSAKVMRYQLLIGLISLIVYLLHVHFQSHVVGQRWSNQVFSPVIAGVFTYLSTVHMIPEVMRNNRGLRGTILKVNTSIISTLIVLYLKQHE